MSANRNVVTDWPCTRFPRPNHPEDATLRQTVTGVVRIELPNNQYGQATLDFIWEDPVCRMREYCTMLPRPVPAAGPFHSPSVIHSMPLVTLTVTAPKTAIYKRAELARDPGLDREHVMLVFNET